MANPTARVHLFVNNVTTSNVYGGISNFKTYAQPGVYIRVEFRKKNGTWPNDGNRYSTLSYATTGTVNSTPYLVFTGGNSYTGDLGDWRICGFAASGGTYTTGGTYSASFVSAATSTASTGVISAYTYPVFHYNVTPKLYRNGYQFSSSTYNFYCNLSAFTQSSLKYGRSGTTYGTQSCPITITGNTTNASILYVSAVTPTAYSSTYSSLSAVTFYGQLTSGTGRTTVVSYLKGVWGETSPGTTSTAYGCWNFNVCYKFQPHITCYSGNTSISGVNVKLSANGVGLREVSVGYPLISGNTYDWSSSSKTFWFSGNSPYYYWRDEGLPSYSTNFTQTIVGHSGASPDSFTQVTFYARLYYNFRFFDTDGSRMTNQTIDLFLSGYKGGDTNNRNYRFNVNGYKSLSLPWETAQMSAITTNGQLVARTVFPSEQAITN